LDHQGFEGLSGSLLAFMHRSGRKKFMTTKLPRYLSRNQANSGGAT